MRRLAVSVQAGLTADRLGARPERRSAARGCAGFHAQTAPTRSGTGTGRGRTHAADSRSKERRGFAKITLDVCAQV